MNPVQLTDDASMSGKSKGVPVVYLAGPMRGHAELNFHAFDRYRDWLTDKGVGVVSPADIDRDHGFDPVLSQTANFPSANDCLLRDVTALITVDAVCLMPGWKTSRGAMMEVACALFLNLPMFELPNYVPGKYWR